jgi:hypothetical protein
MEVTNRSLYHAIPLVVGQRICQIVFNATTGAENVYKGKYQSQDGDLATIMANWTPSMMLPRIYNDWELALSVHERPGSLVSAEDEKNEEDDAETKKKTMTTMHIATTDTSIHKEYTFASPSARVTS